ncbi:MAG: hypothetical protein JWR16_812 [Nevskia sp.]|nr:hypothetical protein [Nevskia sp.]
MKHLTFFLLGCACGIASASDSYTIGSDQDPRVRASDFMAENRRFLAASTSLIQIQKEAPRQQLPSEYFQRLADDTLSFGMQKRAEVIYREQNAGSNDPVMVARARLRRAEFLYERGFLPEANAELTSLRQQLPSPLMVNWQDQMSRVLMAQDRYAEAVQVLSKPDNANDQSGYMRYNLAIALLKSNHVDEGVNLLDRVGLRRATDSEGLALRDKANLTLGYYWLKRQQGGSAIPILDRIRTTGPYSNRALLGLGWAYLAPEGDKQRRMKLQDDSSGSDSKSFSTIGSILRPGYLNTDIYKRAGLRPFQLNRVDPNDEAALKKALVPWVELVSRDPIDPAVQEGLLAIPYVLDRLGAHIQAQQYYEKAIAALEQTRVNLDQAILSIRYGRMVDTIISRNGDADSGWVWRLKDLPDAPETFYLQTLLADHPFQEAIKNFRDIRLLLRDTDAERQRILDLQAAYDTRVKQPVTQRELQQRIGALSKDANLGYQPDVRPQLQMAQMLVAAPYEDKAANVAPQPPPVKLQLPNAPTKFDGPYERLEALKARLDTLSPKLKVAEEAGSKLLQKIALNDLDAQRKLNEQYLVEARFALARIYDRQAHGEAP